MKRSRIAGIGVLLLAACAADARIFWGKDRTTAGLVAETDADYRLAYTAELTVNQGRGNLEVWGTARTPEGVLLDLQAKARRRGGQAVIGGGDLLGWGVAATPDGRIHRILVTAAEGRYSHVFQLSQSLEDYRRSQTPPARLPLEVPPVPGARVDSFLANEDAGTSLATLSTDGDPLAVRGPYAAALKAAGWERVPAGGGDAAAFLQKGAFLLVSVKRTGDGGRTLVTFAHKRLNKGADRP